MWYKNPFFLIPRLAVISLNLAFQSPFLAPQPHKHLETTNNKKRGCWVNTSRTLPSVHGPHAVPARQSRSPDHSMFRDLDKARRLEAGTQVAGFNTLTQCQMTRPTHGRRTAGLHCIANVAVLKYKACWNSFGTVKVGEQHSTILRCIQTMPRAIFQETGSNCYLIPRQL